jgi:hypothetical protein
MRPYLKKTLHKKSAGGVAQGVGPEFKPHFHQKKKKGEDGESRNRIEALTSFGKLEMLGCQSRSEATKVEACTEANNERPSGSGASSSRCL